MKNHVHGPALSPSQFGPRLLDRRDFLRTAGGLAGSVALLRLLAGDNLLAAPVVHAGPGHDHGDAPASATSNAPKRNAVSTVMPRRPFTISLMRRGGTSMARAKAYWLMPRGFSQSSSKMVPG